MCDQDQHDEQKELHLPPGKKYFTPKEAARILGISENALRSRRQRGQINATVREGSSTVYTDEDILNADVSQRKRGPKPRKRVQTQSDPRPAYVSQVA